MPSGFRTAAFALALAALFVLAAGRSPARSEEPVGRIVGDRHTISVIDGDTIQIGHKIIQLAGIDAPEIGQMCLHDGEPWKCGLEAAYALHKLIELAAEPIVCTDATVGKNGVITATCEGPHENLAISLLRAGYVFALPNDPFYYRSIEDHARNAKLGVWGGKFVLPWEWRKGERLPGETEKTDPPCEVIGKISPTGERLYYVPTDPGFDKIKVDPAHGDRRFCSDQAARAAGWLRPGQEVR